jgi:hypothetical protein
MPRTRRHSGALREKESIVITDSFEKIEDTIGTSWVGVQ